MHAGFDLFPLIIYIHLSIYINQSCHCHQTHIARKYRDISSSDDSLFDSPSVSSTTAQPILFFQNEPVPLASSVVDDLTTLASTVYIISFIIVIFVLLAWITHYNAPCSSLITSILSTITGLPEPIIHSVALCGSCCIWCEKTWLFRRIHQFNIWMSIQIRQFVSGTCKVVYDTICPCCRPPDTPSNRSIIASLPASIIAMINVPDAPNPSLPKPSVTVLEPTAISPGTLAMQVDSHTSSTTGSLIDHDDSITSDVIPMAIDINAYQIDENKSTRKKHPRRPRKQTQLKQQSMISDSSHISEESHPDVPMN